MNNCLFKDSPTSHRIRLGKKVRVVYARTDWEGNFVRFVVLRDWREIDSISESYLPARVEVASWFEVFEHNFYKG